MSYRATLSCDQPDCTTSLSASVATIDRALSLGDWKTEITEQGTFYTCPNHKPDTVPVALRRLADVGRHLLLELRELDENGYYIVGTANADGAALHVLPYQEDDSGPFVLITRSGRTFRARLFASDCGPVVFDEDSEVWG